MLQKNVDGSEIMILYYISIAYSIKGGNLKRKGKRKIKKN